MAREKIDNKLNVVIGTKAQIEGDTSIPENSIIVVTDEELKADEIVYSAEKNVKEAIEDLEANKVDIVDNLITNDSDKVLSAAQGKVLQDTKVSKVTTAGLAAYTKNGTTQSIMNIDNASPTASTLVQRDTSGRIKASAGVANNDVVNVEQLNNALGDIDSALDAILGV